MIRPQFDLTSNGLLFDVLILIRFNREVMDLIHNSREMIMKQELRID